MTIGQKFLVYLTLFAFLPSTVVIYIGWYLSCREIRSVNDQNLLALHAQVSAQIENFIRDGLELARAMGQSPPVV